jgi:hypothetical protein
LSETVEDHFRLLRCDSDSGTRTYSLSLRIAFLQYTDSRSWREKGVPKGLGRHLETFALAELEQAIDAALEMGTISFDAAI